MVAKIRRLVLDVVVPNVSDVIELTQELAGIQYVVGVNVMVSEIDESVKTLKLILEGLSLDIKSITKVVEDHGGSIHSVDSIAAGKEIIEDVETPQD